MLQHGIMEKDLGPILLVFTWGGEGAPVPRLPLADPR